MRTALVVGALVVVAALAAKFFTRRNPHVRGADGSMYDIVNTTHDPVEADQQVLDNLRRLGGDLTKVTTVNFYLYVPTREDAEAAGRHLDALEGFATEVHEAALGGGWLCLAARQMPLDDGEIFTLSALLEVLAERHQGEYDGWEAEVVK